MDADFTIESEDKPKKLSQGKLNDLIKDLSLSKDKPELLAVRQKEKCLLKKYNCITNFSRLNRLHISLLMNHFVSVTTLISYFAVCSKSMFQLKVLIH